jgi:hypothetical protein
VRYRLAVLTHGDAPHLDRAIESFAEHASPAPADLVCVVDGPGRTPPVEPFGQWRGLVLPQQSGFCFASRELWRLASEPNVEATADYVFWLENDFVLTRPVDLSELAYVLDDRWPRLAQMQLMRGAVNAEERAAGGLYESRPGQYEPRTTVAADSTDPGDWWNAPWLEHRSYMTTNPCLMPADFMLANPWPGYDRECEGRFGIDLVKEGYTFGVWGDGSPWCEHIGQRDGFGY